MIRSVLTILSASLLLAVGCSDSHTDVDGGISLMDSGPRPDTGGGGVDGGGGLPDSSGGPADTGVRVDAGPRPDGGAVGIDCMGSTCDPATQECCITGMPGGGGPMGMCIDIGAACMGAAIDCDGPEDCGSAEVCCARGSLGGITVACDTAEACAAGGFGTFELCHDVADCTTAGDMCCPIDRGGFSASYCSTMCFGTGGP